MPLSDFDFDEPLAAAAPAAAVGTLRTPARASTAAPWTASRSPAPRSKVTDRAAGSPGSHPRTADVASARVRSARSPAAPPTTATPRAGVKRASPGGAATLTAPVSPTPARTRSVRRAAVMDEDAAQGATALLSLSPTPVQATRTRASAVAGDAAHSGIQPRASSVRGNGGSGASPAAASLPPITPSPTKRLRTFELAHAELLPASSMAAAVLHSLATPRPATAEVLECERARHAARAAAAALDFHDAAVGDAEVDAAGADAALKAHTRRHTPARQASVGEGAESEEEAAHSDCASVEPPHSVASTSGRAPLTYWSDEDEEARAAVRTTLTHTKLTRRQRAPRTNAKAATSSRARSAAAQKTAATRLQVAGRDAEESDAGSVDAARRVTTLRSVRSASAAPPSAGGRHTAHACEAARDDGAHEDEDDVSGDCAAATAASAAAAAAAAATAVADARSDLVLSVADAADMLRATEECTPTADPLDVMHEVLRIRSACVEAIHSRLRPWASDESRGPSTADAPRPMRLPSITLRCSAAAFGAMMAPCLPAKGVPLQEEALQRRARAAVAQELASPFGLFVRAQHAAHGNDAALPALADAFAALPAAERRVYVDAATRALRAAVPPDSAPLRRHVRLPRDARTSFAFSLLSAHRCLPTGVGAAVSLPLSAKTSGQREALLATADRKPTLALLSAITSTLTPEQVVDNPALLADVARLAVVRQILPGLLVRRRIGTFRSAFEEYAVVAELHGHRASFAYQPLTPSHGLLTLDIEYAVRSMKALQLDVEQRALEHAAHCSTAAAAAAAAAAASSASGSSSDSDSPCNSSSRAKAATSRSVHAPLLGSAKKRRATSRR